MSIELARRLQELEVKVAAILRELALLKLPNNTPRETLKLKR